MDGAITLAGVFDLGDREAKFTLGAISRWEAQHGPITGFMARAETGGVGVAEAWSVVLESLVECGGNRAYLDRKFADADLRSLKWIADSAVDLLAASMGTGGDDAQGNPTGAETSSTPET